jgi:hypothetical protein
MPADPPSCKLLLLATVETMPEDLLREKCQRILSRMRRDGRTPMMRFLFANWSRPDYEALDRLLARCDPPTCRYILPADEGILVGSEGWCVGPIPLR